jgi:hypothetical protein
LSAGAVVVVVDRTDVVEAADGGFEEPPHAPKRLTITALVAAMVVLFTTRYLRRELFRPHPERRLNAERAPFSARSG